MMNQVTETEIPIFWIVLVAYMGVLVAFGIYSKKRTKSVEDYLIAGKSIGPFLLGISFGVTYFSSVLVIGGGGQAFVWGLGAIWIAAFNVLIGIVLVFILFGRRTKILSDQCKSVTVPQLLAFRYQDKNYQIFVGLVVMFFEMIYLVSVYTGLAKLLTLLTPNGTQAEADLAYLIGVALCGGITIFYLVFGGSIGAILSDAFESIIMLVGILLITIIGFMSIGGIDGLLNGLAFAETGPTIVGTLLPTRNAPFTAGSLTQFVGFGGMGLLGFMLVTSFGQWGMPQALSRFFTAKSKKAIKYGLIIACGWAGVVAFLSYFNGALANAYWFLHLNEPGINDNILRIFKDIDMNIPLFLRNVVPAPIVAIFIAAVTAASMTTEEKVVLISASGFSQDVYQNLAERGTRPKIPDEKMLKVTKLATFVVIIVALLFALGKIDFVLTLCMFAWSAIASAVLVPFVFGLFWKRGTAKAAWTSGIVALSVAIIWWFIFRFSNPAVEFMFHDIRAVVLLTVPFKITLGDFYTVAGDNTSPMSKAGIHEFIVSQVVAICVFVIVSLFTKPPKNEFVDAVFKEFKIRKAQASTSK
jgi:SSS family solute:Na+ symporter